MTQDAPETDIAQGTQLPERSIWSVSVRTAAVLLLYITAFTALMAATYRATLEPITASLQKEKLALIGEVLPPDAYDNALLDDWIDLPPTAELGLTDSTHVFRARKSGKPAALIIEAAAPDGYSGRIGLLLAVKPGGELIAIRVTEHHETPGLGDYIVPKKDKNKQQPWITQFNGLSLDVVTPALWRVKKDGGRFDQRSGATISARAVTNASGQALAWVKNHHEKLFAAANGAHFNEEKP